MFPSLENAAGPDGTFKHIRFPVTSDVCHRGGIYSVMKTVQRPGNCSDVCETVHWRKVSKAVIANAISSLK